MDYKEEQNGEIEALESIYYGDVTILSKEPFYKFSIPIKSEEFEPDTENGLGSILVFTYTEKYPDEPPVIEVEDSENISDEDIEELANHIMDQAKENLGMVMIFTLVSAGQEWLNVKWEQIKKVRDERLLKKQIEDEEAERQRFEGTRVTVETFLRWKMKFEDESGITKKKEQLEKEGKKLTGRELFMTDNSLNESDLKFLEDGAETVKVDESLFQDLDDLDLDDEEEDDVDFDPNNCSDDESD